MQIKNKREALDGTNSIMSTFCGPKGPVMIKLLSGCLQQGWGLSLVN